MFLSTITASNISHAQLNGQPVTRQQMNVFTTVVIIEIILFIWALVLAFRCPVHNKGERFLYVWTAFFFPIVFLIFAYFQGCKMLW